MVHIHTPLFMDKAVLSRIREQDGFDQEVIRVFGELSQVARIKPLYSPHLLHDAWQSFKWDLDRLDGNMPDSKPDHFKICGLAAYWLRRHSPIIDFEEDRVKITRDATVKEWRGIFEKYDRVFLPFAFGYRICYFFESNKETDDGKEPRLPVLDTKYIEAQCYVMKYKNISPHAMGMVYRALFL